MANIDGVGVIFSYSTDSGTTWKELICEIQNSFNFERSFNSTRTKCDGGTTAKSKGAYDWSFDIEAVADTAPSGTQGSYEDILAIAVAGTTVLGRIQNPSSGSPGTNFYESGTGFISNLSRTAAVDDTVQFNFTFQGDGALDITP